MRQQEAPEVEGDNRNCSIHHDGAIPAVVLAHEDASDSTQTVPCSLQKVPTADNHPMTDQNGKIWDIHGKTVQLGSRVNHTADFAATISQKLQPVCEYRITVLTAMSAASISPVTRSPK